jgi:hypothetical protein
MLEAQHWSTATNNAPMNLGHLMNKGYGRGDADKLSVSRYITEEVAQISKERKVPNRHSLAP